MSVWNSTRSRSRSQIIQVNNSGNGKNISQVQVSPGGGRHGSDPYVKISTTDKGIVKVVEGSKNTYKTDGKEKAAIIFTEEESNDRLLCSNYTICWNGGDSSL